MELVDNITRGEPPQDPDKIIKMDQPNSKKMIKPSQGVHIVLEKKFLDSPHAIMIPHTTDGRVLFAVPWKNYVVVGTTDTQIKDALDEPKPLKEEINFIINNLNEVQTPSNNYSLNLIELKDFQLNKFFYKEIGKEHRWIDRLTWNNNQWIKYVNDPKVRTFILREGDDLAGYYEQIFSEDKSECEIAYFGILDDYIGKKFGGYFLSESIKICFKLNSIKVWVHTCSLDHKHALKNYLSRGMKVFKSEIINLH